MVRTLLADWFQLRAHEEKRLIDAFDLVIAKGGPKIKRVCCPHWKQAFASWQSAVKPPAKPGAP